MSEAELEALVAADQRRRTISRAMGRASKLLTSPTKSKAAKRKSKASIVLESYVAPTIAKSLRQKWPDKSDTELISMLQGKGLL